MKHLGSVNMANRDVLVQKIRQVKADLKTAGVILRCDLQKHIHRMERELENCCTEIG